MERELVGKLKETRNKHRVALSNLEKVIVDGHKYYQQSYTEKKALFDERKFSLPSINRNQSEVSSGEYEKLSMIIP